MILEVIAASTAVAAVAAEQDTDDNNNPPAAVSVSKHSKGPFRSSVYTPAYAGFHFLSQKSAKGGWNGCILR